jgi:hypothetical protein
MVKLVTVITFTTFPLLLMNICWGKTYHRKVEKNKLNKFIEIQNQLNSIVDQPGKYPAKSIKMVANNFATFGYANRMYNLLSCYFIGLMTDRPVVLYRLNAIGTFMAFKYYKDPVGNSFNDYGNQQNELNYEWNKQRWKQMIVNPIHKDDDGTFFGWRSKLNASNLVKHEIDENVDFWELNYVHPYFFPYACNPKYYEKLYRYGLVKRSTIDDAYEKATNVKNKFSNVVRVESLMRVGFEYASTFLRNYWVPKKTLSNLIDYYYNTFFEGNYVIGIQIREYYLSRINMNRDIEEFVACALHLVEAYRKSAGSRKIVWFITSESSRLINNLKIKFPQQTIVVTNGTQGHIGESGPGAHQDEIFVRTALDMELLSRCDELITTGGSTYGFLAAIKANRMPYFVSATYKWTHATFNTPPFVGQFTEENWVGGALNMTVLGR